MKKTLFAFVFILSSISTFSQITATGTSKLYKSYSSIDYIIIFDGIDSSTAIEYTGNFNNISWYYFSDTVNPIATQDKNINRNVEDATGYILDVDGVKTTIWVFDYKNYMPKFTSFETGNNSKNQCNELRLDLQAEIPIMQYKSAQGATFKLDREFEINYTSKEWTDKWSDKTIEKLIYLPQTEIYVTPSPLCNTTFSIEGDQFARDLMISPLPKIESPMYQAVAVECHITTTTATRTELQEGERPEKASVVEGSAPLDIMFESNANVPPTEFYKWEIYKGKELLFTRSDKDQRYTFSESGDFVVKLNVASAYCSNADSIKIKVSDSDIQVPYAFSPNGDGINDEFRVAYRSIVSFKCWVYNRWGKQVFFWTDPQKGWDGKINGKAASQGAYFYIIEAKGADGKEHSRKGNINLLR